VRQGAEQGAEAAVGDWRPCVVAASAHFVFGVPPDELLLVSSGVTREQGVDNNVADSVTYHHDMGLAKVRVVDGGGVFSSSDRARVDGVEIRAREAPVPHADFESGEHEVHTELRV
jgi:hypothetical protein